jgi:hypothetical protein
MIFWDVTPCSQEEECVSEKLTASVFRVEEEAERKQGGGNATWRLLASETYR